MLYYILVFIILIKRDNREDCMEIVISYSVVVVIFVVCFNLFFRN